MLTLVHSRQVACWPWSLGWIDREAVHYATCRTCQRDVAQPKEAAKLVPVCLYCALESGLLPLEDSPLGEVSLAVQCGAIADTSDAELGPGKPSTLP